MMNIEKHISDLLFLHDCVIVPGLGGFVANRKSAHRKEGSAIFCPPVKEIGFNRSLSHNDGLLIHHIAKREGISYGRAKQGLEVLVENITTSINNCNSFEIEDLGVLKSDSIGNILFESSDTLSYMSDSFGLTNFQFKSLHQISQVSHHRQTTINRVFRSSSSRQIAASVAMLMTMLFISPSIKDVSHNSYSSIVPALSELIVVEEESSEMIDVSPENLSIIEVTKELNYYLIGASFISVDPANDLVSKLIKEGYSHSTVVANGNGRYRVALNSFATKEDAVTAMKNLKTTGKYGTAWILHQ